MKMRKIPHTFISRLEAGLLPVVEADTKLDLRDRALAEIADTRARSRTSCGGCSGRSSGGSGSSGIGGIGGSGGIVSTSTGASDWPSLIINLLHGSEVGLDTEDGVESISGGTSLCRGGVACILSLLAGVLGGLISLARVGQRVADELRDNADSLGGTMVE